ncbi:hypothetical protein [Pseudonocardia sp.]|uniref:hypothetical protein n=1 Tax=Pseudonocardia sp. TaxID=60912 RepID=UPI00262B18D2|nr:hypothetical protein [Pseudonocardia sp.]
MLPPDRARRPADVPDCAGPDVTAGLDSDADGTPDSVFADDGEDLLLHTDLDDDGLGDQILRIGPDGGTSVEVEACAEPPTLVALLSRWWRGWS